jgi:hypothetical protein
MARLDELCVEAGRDPSTLRRCYFAGWANEPIFASLDATAEFVGRYAEAGATDFTFYLANDVDSLLDDFVTQHRAATRDQLERVAADVLPHFRD